MPWDEQVIEAVCRGRNCVAGVPANHIDDRESALGRRPHHLLQQIDGLVVAIERHMSRWTAMLHLLQLATMALPC